LVNARAFWEYIKLKSDAFRSPKDRLHFNVEGKMKQIITLVFGVLFSSSVAWSGVITLDFDSLPAGTLLNSQFAGVTFEGVQGDSPGTDSTGETAKDLVIFDTHNASPSTPHPDQNGTNLDGDPDLAWNGGWRGGNLASFDYENIFVIAENTTDKYDNSAPLWSGSPDGLVDVPDDNQNGGNIRLTFETPIIEFQLAVADFEPGELCCMEFFNGSFDQADRVAQIFFDDFTDPLSQYYDSTIEYSVGGSADNVANQLSNITTASFGEESVDRVQINVLGSAGWDLISYTPVPEPATMAFLGFSGLSMLWVRRRWNISI
jgi:hypothetical protein